MFSPPHAHGRMQTRRARRLDGIRARIAGAPDAPLSESERDDLLHMREEEKLARDVYVELARRWNLRPFHNISGAEQAHMDAVAALLAHFGLPDPAAGLEPGRFRDERLQALHDELLVAGGRSELAAVQVGLLIEEEDIADLRAAKARTQNAAILDVYAHLERGSRNHLRAFYRHMQRLEGDYAPRRLSGAEFERIAWSAHEVCGAA